MQTAMVNGRKLVIRHFFPLEEIKVGSTWAPADGGNYTVEITSIDKNIISYRGLGENYKKDLFSFQTRYCLVIEEVQMKVE